MSKNKKIDFEKVVRNVLIVLTAISLIILMLNFSYLIYQHLNIEKINNFLLKYVNGIVLWSNTILLYICAIVYIIMGIKSKKEVALKVSFSVFSILTNILTITMIINQIATWFGMFD